jgi:hypothetical protein
VETINTVYVRFTDIEYNKVSSLPIGSIFTHANLFHEMTKLRIDSSEYQYGVKILVGGKNLSRMVVNPILDTENMVKLKLLEIHEPIQITKQHGYANLLLHNEKGLYESLWDRYGIVMELTREELSTMKYYTRIFEKV